MTEDERNNSLEFSINWNFNDQDRVWRFICFLVLGVETTDADLWLTDISNHNLQLIEREYPRGEK